MKGEIDPHEKGTKLSERCIPFLEEEVFGKYWGKVIYYEDINTPSLSEWGELL